MVAFSRCLILKGSSGLLCLFTNNSEILATKKIAKEPLTTETAVRNYLKKNKKSSKDQEYKKEVEQKRCVKIVKNTLTVMMVLILFINWWYIGFRFLYVYGVCGLLYFFIVRQAENIDYSKLTSY
jgi:uncharacterized ion transporter superfamily protein YfcC